MSKEQLLSLMAVHHMNVRCERMRDNANLSISSFAYWESSTVQTYAVADEADGYIKALEAAVYSFLRANNLTAE